VPRLKSLTPTDGRKALDPSMPSTPPPQALGEETGGEVFYQNRNSRHQHTHSNDLPKSPVSDKPNTIVARQQSTPISTKPVRTNNPAALFASSVEDPWGAPPQSVNPQPSASAPPQAQQQQQSGDMDGQNEEEDVHEPDDIHAALRNAGPSRVTTSSTWAGDNYSVQQSTYGADNYNQSIAGFGDHPGLGARHGSFGGLGGNRINGNDERNGNGTLSGLDRVKAAMKAPEEHVNVNILPEKEGMFMFQHRNYQITSTRRGSRVVRRYSDFVWCVPPPSSHSPPPHPFAIVP
jgi:sorting nexin-8